MQNARRIVKRSRHDDPDHDDREYLRMTPAERVGIMWQLAINAWTFAGHDFTQRRLSRRAVVLQRRER
jgi:hypothetical protein